MFLSLLLVCFLVALDQITKHLTVIFLPHPGDSVELIPDFLRLTYVQNPGAAFGSLANARWIFMGCSVVLIVVIVWYYIAKRPQSLLVRAGLILVCSGGIGNMIDRIAYGYVVDMIDFCGIWQFVFNVADSCVCIGAGLIVIYCLMGMVRERRAASQSTDACADTVALTEPEAETNSETENGSEPASETAVAPDLQSESDTETDVNPDWQEINDSGENKDAETGENNADGV